MPVDWAEIHRSRNVSWPTLPLAVCSFLYGLGLRAVRKRRRRRGGNRLPGFVVSIGNLTVGGSGKTPAVAALAGWASRQGYRVAVLSRGYGAGAGKGVRAVSDGKKVLCGLSEAGDEPLMLAGQLPGVPIYVCRDRYLAGRAAHTETGADFFVLDDGFQHWTLARDLDIVLMDDVEPVGNGHLLPWGPLREPVEALQRAHAVVLTRARPHGMRPGPGEEVLSRFPGVPRFQSVHVPSGVVFPGAGTVQPPSHVKGRRVTAFCGIARPEAFRQSLMELGAEVAEFYPFRDHHPFTRKGVDRIVRRWREKGSDLLLTTEKDWMRAGPFLKGEDKAGFLRVELAFHSGKEAFFDLVRDGATAAGVRGAADGFRSME